MAEFTYPEEQTIAYRNPALLNNTSCGCNKGYISHENGFGNVTVKGVVNNPYARYARYEAKFSCNIALAPVATVGPIAVGLTFDGEPVVDTLAEVTPAAVGDYWHVSGFKTFSVMSGCCPSIAVENLSPVTGATGNPQITMRNLNVAVNRIA